MNPIRIQRSRQHKQVSPNGLPIVYVGRRSKYGNPYKSGIDFETVEECINNYEIRVQQVFTKEEIIKDLGGKNLSCWCKIGEPCHADILLKIANQ